MIQNPAFLQKGDCVRIVSPSGPIDKKYIDSAIKTLNFWELEVEVGKNACNKKGVFAGTDSERKADLQDALDAKHVRAIFCARGGFGAIRIAPYLDYSNFISQPKWLIGFSDITVLHSQINKFGISSIHAAMPKNFGLVTKDSLDSLQKMLFGEKESVIIPSSKYNKSGSVTASLVGGNLSILYSIRGVSLEYDYTNKILFIEDLNEYVYHIDRMLQNFKHSGIFSKISGLIVGTMSGMKQGADNYDATTIEEVILDAVKEYDFPVCFDFPSGHEEFNQALLFGSEYSLNVNQKEVVVSPL